jgi:hypothetical protein
MRVQSDKHRATAAGIEVGQFQTVVLEAASFHPDTPSPPGQLLGSAQLLKPGELSSSYWDG